MSKVFKLIIISGITALLLGLFMFKDQVPKVLSAFLSASSIDKTVGSIGTPKNTDGKTNILLLGVDKRAKNNSLLTDTIIVLSIDNETGNTVMVSIPRDLWVNEIKAKVNSVYYWATVNDKEHPAIDSVIKVVSNIIGMPVHYYAVVNFEAFTEAIDAVGGVDVAVNNTFDDYLYPIEGKENAPVEADRYLHIHFDEGIQHMNGATALQYSRSRHSENPKEAGDFARARRQHQVITALKEKITNSDTLFDPLKLKDLFDTYQKNVDTDIGANEIGLFYNAYKNISDGEITSVVLSNEMRDESVLGSGMLYAPSEDDRNLLYNHAYVLIPKDGSFNEIHAMLRSLLFTTTN